MALQNYRDLSNYGSDTSAGFQFEFYCNHCSRNWKSPFKPYRMGQFASIFSMVAPLLGLNRFPAGQSGSSLSTAGRRGAQEKALEEAMQLASTRYILCPKCRKEVCDDCFDGQRQACLSCTTTANNQADASGSPAAAGASCPNCSTASTGGRFCSECGFDMASTHKSCPSCGTMALRQARFCGDCGHSF